MIYRLRHLTEYGYARDVDLGTHVMHLLPREIAGRQHVLDAVLSVEPEPSWRHAARDHFGNAVEWVQIDMPHDRFAVEARSTVEVIAPALPEDGATPAWEEIRDIVRRGGAIAAEAAEFVFPSPRLPASDDAGAFAGPSLATATPILAALRHLSGRIRAEFAFRPGATDLRTTVGEVLRNRAGVCQDFTHLMIAGLRAHGVPARYASGYIRTYPLPGQEKLRGSDVSHAWVEAWLGPDFGWIGIDPTNDLVVTDEHVLLGWGRDFGDVSPLAGMILGGGRHALSVYVDLEPA